MDATDSGPVVDPDARYGIGQRIGDHPDNVVAVVREEVHDGKVYVVARAADGFLLAFHPVTVA